MRATLVALALLLAPAGLFAAPRAAAPAQNARRWTAKVGATEVDVTATMSRIARGEHYPHRNDGTRFQNRERRLPSGHTYTEYVVPTPGQRGPGPRRIIVADDGRAWYTPDHYDHFYDVVSR